VRTAVVSIGSCREGQRIETPGLLFIGSRAVSGESLYFERLRGALEGGIAAFMVREKDLGGKALLEMALRARTMTRAAGARLIVSERLDVAMEAGADGVHLPERSFTPEEARRVIGPEMLIGRSVHGLEGAVEAEQMGADYVMAGPVFETPGKRDRLSFESLLAIRKRLSIGIVPVGGIDLSNIGRIAEAGFDSAAVIRALAAAGNPRESAASLALALGKS